jgi:DNA-directed RNA polymerase subunit RPC12/RpoP
MDICEQARNIMTNGAKINQTNAPAFIYNTALNSWRFNIATQFNPVNEEVTPFYIHVKKAVNSIEKEKRYIGEVFIASGSTEHEALVNLIAYAPDGYIDINLNRNAGGHYIFLGYKRVAKVKDALTDILVYEGKNPAASNRVTIGKNSVKYSLVSDVDLNKNAGGKYLYLYTSDSSNTGNPITTLKIQTNTETYLKCGVERVTVKRADGKVVTDELINFNKSAGGDDLYLIMERETDNGHNLSPDVQKLHSDPTCGDTGHDTLKYTCLDCSAVLKDVTVIPATGLHSDAENDGDHNCDVCGKRSLTTHIRGEEKEEDRKEATEDVDGSYKLVYYCTECNMKLKESKVIIPAGTVAENTNLGASVIGTGSIVAIFTFAALALAAAVAIYYYKKKNEEIIQDE